MWAAWELLERGRHAWPCSRAGSAATGRAGATAGSASRCGCPGRRCASASATSRARALLDASSDAVSQGRRVVRRRGRGRLVRPVRLHVRRPRPRRSTRSAWAPWRRRPRSGRPSGWSRCREADTSPRCASPALPRRRVHPRLRHPAAGAAGARPAPAPDRARRRRSTSTRACAGVGPTVSETDSGSVRAGAVVLAVGPAARAQPRLRSRLTVTSSHIVLTEPVPDVIAELGWTGGECITDGRTLVHYFRTTRDGRILLGWGGGRLGLRRRASTGAWRSTATRRAPPTPRWCGSSRRSRGGAITHAWGGPIDVSPSHIPQIGTLPGQAGPLRRSASRATASARRTWSAARWPRSRPGGADDADPAAAGGRRRRRVGAAGAADLAGRIGRARRARAPRAHPGGRAQARPAHARRVRRAARDRHAPGAVISPHRGQLHLAWLHPPPPGPGGAGRPRAARPVHRVRLPGAHRGAHAAGRHRRVEA